MVEAALAIAAFRRRSAVALRTSGIESSAAKVVASLAAVIGGVWPTEAGCGATASARATGGSWERPASELSVRFFVQKRRGDSRSSAVVLINTLPANPTNQWLGSEASCVHLEGLVYPTYSYTHGVSRLLVLTHNNN